MKRLLSYLLFFLLFLTPLVTKAQLKNKSDFKEISKSYMSGSWILEKIVTLDKKDIGKKYNILSFNFNNNSFLGATKTNRYYGTFNLSSKGEINLKYKNEASSEEGRDKLYIYSLTKNELVLYIPGLNYSEPVFLYYKRKEEV